MNPDKIRDNKLLMWLVQSAGNIETNRQRKRREQKEAERRRAQEEFLIIQTLQEEDRKKRLEQETRLKTINEINLKIQLGQQKIFADTVKKMVEEDRRKERMNKLMHWAQIFGNMQKQ
ncbi:MAG: hypothetical protein NWE90_07855 [Candidatus Bathyarchaeota archaeon]|nr:hypothetical protein [Candidatus Bathyarchaeota archaeon]